MWTLPPRRQCGRSSGTDAQVDAIVGEEMGRSGAVDADRVWLLDPLCGTVNFAAGTGLVAVNAALVEGGRVDAAAVADRSVVSSR